MKCRAIVALSMCTFATALAAVIVVLAIAGNPNVEEILQCEFRSDISASSGVLSDSPYTAEYELRYGYAGLTERERAVYRTIKDAVFNFRSVSADGCDYNTFKKVFVKFCADYPECFWVTGDWTASGYVIGGVRKYTSYSPKYRYTKQQFAETEAKINEIVDDFLAGIPAGASDYDKALAVYRFVSTYAEYDTETSRRLSVGRVDSSTDRSCSIDGYFLDKLAVCSGFSKATQLLLGKLGIECIYVTGRSEGGGHSWNMAKLDGDYYYLDTTWANTRREGTGALTYDFFCITTSELLHDHSIDISSGLPLCSATKLNYFVRNGLVAKSCDENELASLFGASLKMEGGSATAIKFASRELFEKAYSQLFTNSRIFDVLNKAGCSGYSSVRYSADPGRLTITVYLDGVSSY
jgi:hypothetical protein